MLLWSEVLVVMLDVVLMARSKEALLGPVFHSVLSSVDHLVVLIAVSLLYNKDAVLDYYWKKRTSLAFRKMLWRMRWSVFLTKLCRLLTFQRTMFFVGGFGWGVAIVQSLLIYALVTY